MKEINLEFPTGLKGLSGFDYGDQIYQCQVKLKKSFDEKVKIIFPEQIEKVASSFVQGFFSELIKEIGYKKIEKNIVIKTRSEKLTDSIYKNLY